MEFGKIKKRYIPMTETMFYILYSLIKERHGYGIMLYVREITNGRIVLGAGTIYQSISKLEHDKLIESTREEDRKKMYRITDLGKEVLIEESNRIYELYAIAKEII
jgi:DNA-binding PadR family transcriptional regulator